LISRQECPNGICDQIKHQTAPAFPIAKLIETLYCLDRILEDALAGRADGGGTAARAEHWRALARVCTGPPEGRPLGAALLAFDADEAIGCIVLTGGEKAFAAGADIAMMQPYGFVDAYTKGLISRNWETIRQVRKPVIGAVAGFALGGGCELAMMCDFVIAADTAKFGQPEIKLGIIPGAGGTQRLPRAISKAKAMDMVLTARMMDATEAERAGLVSRVVPAAELIDTAIAAAEKKA